MVQDVPEEESEAGDEHVSLHSLLGVLGPTDEDLCDVHGVMALRCHEWKAMQAVRECGTPREESW